jgi:hypothetical protein
MREFRVRSRPSHLIANATIAKLLLTALTGSGRTAHHGRETNKDGGEFFNKVKRRSPFQRKS